MNLEQEIRMLKEQVRSLSQRIEQRPVVQTVKAPSIYYLIIDKGNVLDSGQDGIKFSTTLITSMPTYDPNAASSFIDGVGRAQLVKDGAIQPGYVLVCNDLRSMWSSALLKGDAIATGGAAVISGNVCYIPV
jgi:hypothetical protein